MNTPSHNRSGLYPLTLRAMLAAVAMVLSWLEAQMPVFFAVPGMKLGLTNLVVLLALYRLGWKDALALNMVRIILVGFTFGSLFSMAYSIAGGLLSFAAMLLMKKIGHFSIAAVSVTGGIMHNVGQILVAMAVLQTRSVLWYLPVLWLSGIAAGAVIGILCALMLRHLPESVIRGDNGS